MTDWLVHLLNPLRPLCGDWCLHFWEVVGVWFTGLATFAAVIVSLRLARRESIRIKVSAGHRLLVQPGQPPPWPEILMIIVRNVGSRPAKIEGIGWRRRPWRKLHGYQQFDPTGGFPGPPAVIEPGDSRSFCLPLSADHRMQWGEYFVREFVGRWPRLGVRFIRVLAWTPAGVRCSAFLEPSLRQWLISKAESMPPGGWHEPSDPILKETLEALRPHLHPEWGDRDAMDVFNRLVAKQVRPSNWTPNTHMNIRPEQISSRREQWEIDRLAQIPRSHRDTAGPDTRLDGPIVIVEYQRSMRLLDGSHRINTWLARKDSAQHLVHIHTLKGTAKFVELPAKPR